MNAATPETDITKAGRTGSLSALGRRFGPWLALTLVALGAGLYVRYGLIESTPTGLMCQSAERAWYCLPREAVIQFNLFNGWSWAAMGGGLFAILFGWRWAIVLGIVAGAAGLTLYNAGPAGFGLLLALMRLLRR